ncbi:hypothetical protein D9619_005634 [Psilocybe cf. subviscida]|uniref:Scamp-domain-containing protein n=1 Tax=Psilocybe cf. subviscida TaxID=2480587 RepID=A0A8H5BYK4_9AGAR|nr:hypothetical protein D9619_005634 [Psilocybe cf. subviscida]
MTDFTQNPFASTHSLDTNPFDDPSTQHQSPYPGSASAAEASRLEEIRRREQDLERREAELAAKADHLQRHGKKNFPPFFPLVYHSIADEIPEPHRPLITRLYQLWLVLLATLIVNAVACLVILISGTDSGASDLGSGIGYLVFISILSFLLWYRPIYNGYMKEQALYYCKVPGVASPSPSNPHVNADLYFFFGGFHLLFSLYMIIGIPGTGAAGLITTIRSFSNHQWVAAVFSLLATIGWTIQGVGNAYYYREIYTHHTAAGHTMEKAKTELATHGAKAYFTRG